MPLLVYMMSVDIVNLIETSPITKLNGNYQSKLIEKVKNHFTDYEQQMFVASFYCYLNYNKTDFVIDLDNIWEWLGFSTKQKAKQLLEKNFIIEKDYKILLLAKEKQSDINYKTLLNHQVKQSDDTRGGHNKETFMLTIETFKKYCMKAGTKKADEIHDYFIKLEEILHEIIKEESDELKLQLEQKNTEIQQIEESKEKELEMKLKQQQCMEREKVLLNQYATIGSIIYIIKVKTFKTGEYIIKIGQSRKGIMNRYNEHKHKYEECLLLDCFSVNRSHDFENFLHNHEDVRGNRVNNLLNHETELELFLIGKKLSYKTLLKIINNNLTYFDSNDIRKLEKENEQLKMMMQMKTDGNDSPLIHELINMVKSLTKKIDNLEKLLQEKTTKEEPKITTGFSQPLATIGPRLQQIHPETLQLVKVYETASECMKEDPKMKRPSLTKAVMEKLVYNGFRWLFVDRELDSSVIHSIQPTKQTKTQNLGYIAQINKEQTEIVNVFIDRKTAAQMNGYESTSALDNPVKNFTLTKDSYYKLYDDCNDELKSAFEEQCSGEPFLYKNGAGQFDAQHKLTKEFASKYDCIKQLKMSDKTLTKCYNKNIQYNGYYYKEIGSKLSVK
jgi:phage anti-repressor protein